MGTDPKCYRFSMKIYRVSLSAKIFLILFSLLFTTLGILFLIFNNAASIFERLIMLTGIIFCIVGICAMFRFTIIIDDKRIEIFNLNLSHILSRIKKKEVLSTSLSWDEIGDLNTCYVLYPENPIVILKPKSGIPKKKIEFMMLSMPVELISDILSHLSSDTRISLYSYLKRKIKGQKIKP